MYCWNISHDHIVNPGGLVLSVIFGKCTAKRNSIKALDGGLQALEKKRGLFNFASVIIIFIIIIIIIIIMYNNNYYCYYYYFFYLPEVVMIPQVILLLLLLILLCPEGQASSSVVRNVPLNETRLKR